MALHFEKILKRKVTVLGMRPPLAVRCSPTTTVAEATQIMQSAKIGSVIITEKEVVVGIFTERDYLLKIAGKNLDPEKLPISQFMTKDPVCVDKKAPIIELLRLMRKGNFRHLIVTDGDKHIERVISIKDVTNYLIDVLAETMEYDLDLDSSMAQKAVGAG